MIPYEYFDVLSALHMATFHEPSVEEYKGKCFGEGNVHAQHMEKKKKMASSQILALLYLECLCSCKAGIGKIVETCKRERDF